MSIKENIHFPNHINLDEFYDDYYEKKVETRKLQTKYKLTPRQYRLVIRYFREKYSPKNTTSNDVSTKYIYITPRGRYTVRKRIDGKFKYFGTYKNLDTAMKIHDELIENNWEK